MAVPYIVWSILLLLLPMIIVFFYSITTGGNGIITFELTLKNYIKFFTDPDFVIVLWRSVKIAVKTTIICILLAYPVAYFIAGNFDRMRGILTLAITLPTWINMLVRTYAWIGILTEGGLVSNILSAIGFKNTELLYTESAVLIGMVYNFLPFMILQIVS